MTTAQNAASLYRRNAVLTASREKLVVLLYDGALRFIDQASMGFETGAYAEIATGISRAFGVVSELRSTLDHEQGGDVAANLDRLYRFVQDRLITANRERHLESLNEARRVMATLKEAWDGILGAG